MLGRQMNIYIRKPVYATVIWKCNNNIIKTEQVEIGDSATPPDVEIEGYDFISWDKTYNKILGNVIINAIMKIKTFTVRFFVNGQEIKTQTVEYDKNAQSPDISGIYVEGHYFKEWDTDFTHVKSDLNVNAIYEIYKYEVNFYDNNTLLSSQIVPYGNSATEPTMTDSYDFDYGWDKSFTNVKSNLNIYAIKLIKNVKSMYYNGGLYMIKNNNQMYATGQFTACDLLPEDYDYNDIVYEPKQIRTTLLDTDKIHYGAINNFLIRSDGSLYMCGKLYFNDAGYDNNCIKYDTYTQLSITNVKDVLPISVYAFVALKNDNTLWLCKTSADGTFSFNQISSGIKSLEMNNNFSSDDLALTNSSILVIKTDNALYQLDKLYSSSALTSTKLCDSVSKFFANRYETMYVVKTDGSLYGMGHNYYGKLGLGHTNKVTSFTKLNITGTVKKIVFGNFMDAILLENGTVWGAGNNAYGGFGMGNFGDDYLTYTQLPLSDVKDIFSAHTNALYAVKNDGIVLVSGDNDDAGYLGTGGTESINTFTQVPNLNNPIDIVSKNKAAIALNQNGTVLIAGWRYPLFRENDTNTLTFERV